MTQAVKILIATDSYKFNTGGVTASVLALCRGLRRMGHDVKVLAPSEGLKSFRDGDDFYIKSVPAFYYPGMRVAFSIHDPLLKELEAWHPDVIHIQTEGAAGVICKGLVKRCGSPLVMTCHTDYARFVFGRMHSLPPIEAFMCGMGKIIYKDADRVIAPSRKAGNFAFLHSVQNRIAVIPNGIEMEKYRKTISEEERKALRLSLGICESERVIVSVSRLSKEKNIGEIIGAMPRLLERIPDTKLLIVGDGPYKSRLEKQAEETGLKDNIIFTGYIPSDAVWRYYGIGDIFVSASTFEVHSMSYLEALAQGLPLLCREDDSLAGVLEHGVNGMMYRLPEEFADHAYRMLTDGEMRRGMGQKSLERAELFTSDAFARTMTKLYEDAIRKMREKEEPHMEGGNGER